MQYVITPPQILSHPSQEFYALLSFATPGVLGPMATFKRVYAGAFGERFLGGIGLTQSIGSREDGEAAWRIRAFARTRTLAAHKHLIAIPPLPRLLPDPISRSQTKEATPTDKELGTARAA